MKRKRMDRDIWTSIKSKVYTQREACNADFRGVVSLLCLNEVDPVSAWEMPCGKITVCESGMKWLQLLPRDENYMITAMINAGGKIALVYIDIIAGYGYDGDGVAFYDDLYLDLIVMPDGSVGIYDMEELDEARANGDITEELYILALNTQDKLLSGMLKDKAGFDEFCHKYLSFMQSE